MAESDRRAEDKCVVKPIIMAWVTPMGSLLAVLRPSLVPDPTCSRPCCGLLLTAQGWPPCPRSALEVMRTVWHAAAVVISWGKPAFCCCGHAWPYDDHGPRLPAAALGQHESAAACGKHSLIVHWIVG